MIWLAIMKRGELSDSSFKDICYDGCHRYDRQIILPELGDDGQALLAAARVLVVGAGGLGSPVALYLAAAGVGTIGLVDFDTVGWSNLNRQILYCESDIGLSKVSVAAQRLRKLNSSINIVEHFGKLSSCDEVKVAVQTHLPETLCSGEESERKSSGNTRCLDVWRLVNDYDIVIDACDNLATRHLVGKVTAELGIPYIFGAIDGFCGQLSVFNYGEGAQRKRFSDLWPDDLPSYESVLPPEESESSAPETTTIAMANEHTEPTDMAVAAEHTEPTDMAVAAVGVTAGVIGSLQASEAIKIICGFGDVLAGQLLTVDLRTLEIHKLTL